MCLPLFSFKIFEERSKVMKWLEEQPELSLQHGGADASAMILQDTMKFDHILHSSHSFQWKFSVSESGSIAIAPYLQSPLSVVFPGSDKSPLILSDENSHYDSVLFVKISRREYLAAVCDGSIHLWDIAKKSSCVVYSLKDKRKMSLCAIDERTVACGRALPSGDGISRIHILHTELKKWKLSGTLMVRTKSQINDICHVKTADGTPCLLVSCEMLIQSVQMVGGKIRWQVDHRKMGHNFYPCSICVDGTTIYVTDSLQQNLHLFSPEDGSVITSISLLPFGVSFPSCVRLQDEYLYIGHIMSQYAISKLTKQATI